MPEFHYALARCYGCQRPFGCNPGIVPSIIVNGVREAICPQCVEQANPHRIERGLAPIVPAPGAYDPEEL